MSMADLQWCPTNVQVTVLQSRGLRIKGKNGTNDAYAIMQVGKEKFQTSVMEKSVAPVWKEEAAFDLPPPGRGGPERGTLHVHVLHRALVGPDKLLGQAVINLLELSEDKTRSKTEWFKLLDKTGKADKDRGEVLVDIQFTRNNMTASMFDISAAGKSKSRLGKFKDKVRGKKKESDAASNILPSFSQVLTDSEEEGNGEGNGEGTAGKDDKKKKHKIKSLFSTKSNLQRNMSQSMSILPAKNSSLSGSQSSGLNVDSSEGKKKFKFMIHKRSGSSDSKDSGHQKQGAAEQSNLCINGSHVYREEPPPRSSRIGSNFSLTSSGNGSMEDVPENSPPSVDSLRAVRQYSPWTEEEEEEEEVEEVEHMEQDVEEQREEERIKMEKERSRKQEEEQRVRKQEEEIERLAEEKRLEEEKRREEERVRKEEEDGIRREEEEERSQEERRRQEEEERERLAEEKRRREEQERIEEEKVRKEDEERIRIEEETGREEEERERLAEEKRRREEQERIEEEKVRKEEERRQGEEKERARRQEDELAEEKRRLEEERQIEEEGFRKEEEKRMRREQERAEEEQRSQEEEHEKKRRREEQEERQREEEDRIRMEEERTQEEHEKKRRREEQEERQREDEDRIRMEEERTQEEKRRQEESARREEQCRSAEKRRVEEERSIREEMRIRREEAEEERRQRETEEMVRRQQEEREEQERRQREEEERMKTEEEETTRREKETLRQEEERRRIEAEEKKKQEERIRMEEEMRRRKKEEERKQLAEEKRKLEEQEMWRIEEEEKFRKEEERRQVERSKKEKEERLLEEEMRRETKRIEEEEKVKREEEERIRREEKERGEEARKLEEEKATLKAEQQKKKDASENKPKAAVEIPAEVSSNPFDEKCATNPFEEDPDSPAGADGSADKMSAIQQRVQSAAPLVGSKSISTDEKDPISAQREKRLAPQPPGRNQDESQKDGSAQQLPHITKKSSDKDIKTISVLPQRSVQMIAPISRPSTDAKNTQSLTQSSAPKETSNEAKHSKRPAPLKPLSVEEEPSSKPKITLSSDGSISHTCLSVAKQVPIAYGLNPFEDDEEDIAPEDEAAPSSETGSGQRPSVASQAADKDDASQTKIKPSKARAPLPSARKAATMSTLINQNEEGEHVTGATDNVTHASDPKSEAKKSLHVQEAPLRESQPATVQSAGEEAGGKKGGAPVPLRRLQPVKPLNPLEQQSVSVVQEERDTKSSRITCEDQEKTKVDAPRLKGPYSQLTQEETHLSGAQTGKQACRWRQKDIRAGAVHRQLAGAHHRGEAEYSHVLELCEESCLGFTSGTLFQL
ncbi:trichohyalin-like [Gymnodraco acuticeps]|uniref:Trichohyalin-like n=1 Tax=Gymnodraco acuticeps TaxID=8218 RepID=A0A6P8VHQ3_GYMAC|nr:trichohyalin-like [Gymnodraco acuticeps]